MDQATYLAAWPQGQECIPGVVTCRPKPVALLSLLGPGEVGGSIVPGDLLCGGQGVDTCWEQPIPLHPVAPSHTCPLQLLFQCLLGTMELKEECGCHRAVQFVIPVAGIYRDIIQEL